MTGHCLIICLCRWQLGPLVCFFPNLFRVRPGNRRRWRDHSPGQYSQRQRLFIQQLAWLAPLRGGPRMLHRNVSLESFKPRLGKWKASDWQKGACTREGPRCSLFYSNHMQPLGPWHPINRLVGRATSHTKPFTHYHPVWRATLF